jgi:hypothetical protein
MANDDNGSLTRLKHALQLLALPADVQLASLPNGVCKADELALDFDHWFNVVNSDLPARFSDEQAKALAAIDRKLESMTQVGGELWSDEAVTAAVEWQVLRELARQALTSFGWKAEIPPSYEREYVLPPQRRVEK